MKQDTVAVSRSWTDSLIVIRANARRPLLAVGELWEYREVLHALVWREMKVRYAQTIAGASWVILQPLLTTAVLNILAGRWMRVPTDGVPYPLFAYSGLVPWVYFTHVLTKSAASLLGTGLLSKAYFPRLLLPLAVAAGGAIDLLVASTLLVGLIAYYGVAPSWTMVWLPFVLLLTITVAFGFGVWLAPLNLFHRDVAHALPFGTQLLFFMTPVAYPLSVVPESWRLVCAMNPRVAVVECWRWALFAGPARISLLELAISLIVGAVVWVSGLWYFSRHEPTFADAGEA
ncbi:MAG TPA: ABC transporter permease [Vicinamibacterales bacterium]|nr:ABC transporter permease [Vicinamibacterales bacterium]